MKLTASETARRIAMAALDNQTVGRYKAAHKLSMEAIEQFEAEVRADEQLKNNRHDQIKTIQTLIDNSHATAKSKGWHDKPIDDGTCIALMHSELSEALEGMRKGGSMAHNWPEDKHCPGFSNPTIELADCFIRILDFAGKKHLLLAEGILVKMEYNKTRPHKHGGKEF